MLSNNTKAQILTNFHSFLNIIIHFQLFSKFFKEKVKFSVCMKIRDTLRSFEFVFFLLGWGGVEPVHDTLKITPPICLLHNSRKLLSFVHCLLYHIFVLSISFVCSNFSFSSSSFFSLSSFLCCSSGF
ncbi:MAG: hypothetical protein K0R93_3694 [Anaerosolibacter sp.]|nr:hypothetical protein [Anaerosolibacter sp.]